MSFNSWTEMAYSHDLVSQVREAKLPKEAQLKVDESSEIMKKLWDVWVSVEGENSNVLDFLDFALKAIVMKQMGFKLGK